MQDFSNALIYETSTRESGNLSFTYGEESNVLANREKFLAKFGFTCADTVVMSLHHGDTIKVVGTADKGTDSPPADALVTKDPGVVLFLLTADCLPIVFYDAVNRVAALAHLGWKGTQAKLSEKVVRFLREQFGSNPADIHIFIGPGVHKESYIFPDPKQKGIDDWGPFLEQLPDGQTSVDIVGYNVSQLVESGIPKANISVSDTDTCRSQEFFSHYRAKRTGEREGRFATIAAIKEE